MNILATARLSLRTVTPDDAPFYLALLNDPDFIANIGDRAVRTLAAARDAIAAGPVQMQASLGHSLYLVQLRGAAGAATPIGMCGLIKRDILDDVDIGYAFMPAYRGQGYAFEAASACVAHARSLGLARLLAITSPDNVASNRLLEKLGMRFEKLIYYRLDHSATRLYRMELAGIDDDPGNPGHAVINTALR